MSIYLITGVAGFIGSSIAEALVAFAAKKCVASITSLTGKRSNLDSFLPHIDFREADLRDEAAMRAACEGVDTIFPRRRAAVCTALGEGPDSES